MLADSTDAKVECREEGRRFGELVDRKTEDFNLKETSFHVPIFFLLQVAMLHHFLTALPNDWLNFSEESLQALASLLFSFLQSNNMNDSIERPLLRQGAVVFSLFDPQGEWFRKWMATIRLRKLVIQQAHSTGFVQYLVTVLHNNALNSSNEDSNNSSTSNKIDKATSNHLENTQQHQQQQQRGSGRQLNSLPKTSSTHSLNSNSSGSNSSVSINEAVVVSEGKLEWAHYTHCVSLLGSIIVTPEGQACFPLSISSSAPGKQVTEPKGIFH